MNKPRRTNYQKCFRCQGTNTDRVSLSNGDYGLVVIGWCNFCNEEYSYSDRIDDIYDKEERI